MPMCRVGLCQGIASKSFLWRVRNGGNEGKGFGGKASDVQGDGLDSGHAVVGENPKPVLPCATVEDPADDKGRLPVKVEISDLDVPKQVLGEPLCRRGSRTFGILMGGVSRGWILWHRRFRVMSFVD